MNIYGYITNIDENNQQYVIDKNKFVKRVYKGDQLLVPSENDGQIILTVRDTLSSFGLDTPAGIFYVDLAEESEIDIDGDSNSDMIVYVSDISQTACISLTACVSLVTSLLLYKSLKNN